MLWSCGDDHRREREEAEADEGEKSSADADAAGRDRGTGYHVIRVCQGTLYPRRKKGEGERGEWW